MGKVTLGYDQSSAKRSSQALAGKLVGCLQILERQLLKGVPIRGLAQDEATVSVETVLKIIDLVKDRLDPEEIAEIRKLLSGTAGKEPQNAAAMDGFNGRFPGAQRIGNMG